MVVPVCGCGCNEGGSSLGEIDYAAQCECRQCGKPDADGTRRCDVWISPLLKYVTAIELCLYGEVGQVPGYCGNCRNHNIREHKRAIMDRARDRSRSRSRKARHVVADHSSPGHSAN